jgi:hypothetical protein
MAIGSVTISQKNIPTIKVKGTGQTSIVYPGFAPKVNVAVDDVIGLSSIGVENGYTFVYNANTQTFEASSITEADLVIRVIVGGTF